jgi:membrane-associated phospholipid phosphatase
VFLWIVEHRVAALDWLFVALSVSGIAGLLWIALAPALALVAGRPPLPVALVTAATVWAADLPVLLLKLAVGRERPFAALPEADPLLTWSVSSSFPSGHAATSAAGAVILAFLLGRFRAPLALLAAAMCYSRVYIGVHYPLDVLAGAAIGLVAGFAAVALVRRLRPTSAAPRRSGGATPGG